MKKAASIISVILFVSSFCSAAAGDYNDPYYVVVNPYQWQTIDSNLAVLISNQQQFHSDSLFLLQVIAITAGLSWGALTWHLILKAKDSKKFW